MANVKVLLGLGVLFCSNHFFVCGDYPPPSEDGHSYYSRGGRTSLANGANRMGLSSSYGSVTDWTVTDWSQTGTARCVDIPSNLTLCRNMEYLQMRLPNLLEHDTLREVVQQASSWVRLVHVSCHPDTQVFLCSLFAPVCLDRPVWPCRSLCDAVKSGCEDRMLKYGFPWPDMLRCDQFPADNDICVGLRSTDSTEVDTSCPACRQIDAYDSIISKYCSSDFAMRIKVDQTIVSGTDLKIVADKKRKVFKTLPSLKAKQIRDVPMFIENGASCDCSLLEQNRRSVNSNTYMVMGRKLADRLVVDTVLSLDRRSAVVTRALRAIRERNVCRQQAAINSTPGPVAATNAANANNRRRTKVTTMSTTLMPTTWTSTTMTTTTTTVKPNNGRRRQQSSGSGRASGGRQRGQSSYN